MKYSFIFGLRTVIEAIKAGTTIDRVVIKKGLKGEVFGELMTLLNSSNVPFQFVPEEKLNRITQKNHQGVLAYVSLIEYYSIEQVIPAIFDEGKSPLILLLDNITDVRNFGAIARVAECAGVDAIVIPHKGAAQINADAMKTSSGAINHIKICRSKRLKDIVMYLKESGLRIFAANEKADEIYYNADFRIPAAIIFGAEDIGISEELARMADELIRIPITGKVESLNVSTAAAIIVYEAVKQRLEL